MCIIIAHQGKLDMELSDETLDICLHNHPHGFGLMWLDENGKLQIQKSMEEPPIRKLYRQLRDELPNNPVVLHYRRATQGVKDVANCHPMVIRDGLAFVHNKTVHPCKPALTDKSGKSDTAIFNETVLQQMTTDAMRSPGVTKMLETYIGNSRIAVLGEKEGLFFWNKKKGETRKGLWFSNDSYKAKEYKPENGYSNHGYSGGGYYANFYNDDPHDAIRAYVDRPRELPKGAYARDGLVCYWDAKARGTVAWDWFEKSWRKYDPVDGMFVVAPKTIPGHNPAQYKKPGVREHEAALKKGVIVECPCCETETYAKDLRTDDASLWDGHATCPECAAFFNDYAGVIE